MQSCTTEPAVEQTTSFRPHVDIISRDDALELVVDIPGADEAHTDVTVDRNVLTLKATVEPHTHDGYSLTHTEYRVGNYERAFTLPNEIDMEAIAATVRDGVLRITLPRAKAAGARRIAVNKAVGDN